MNGSKSSEVLDLVGEYWTTKPLDVCFGAPCSWESLLTDYSKLGNIYVVQSVLKYPQEKMAIDFMRRCMSGIPLHTQ